MKKTILLAALAVAMTAPAFADSSRWIHERLWVEAEFDSDGDGEKDRLHVEVYRPQQTEAATTESSAE